LSSQPAVERETAAFLAIAAEISFFSAILGAYLVLKSSDAKSAQTCFTAALAIIAAHLLYGIVLGAWYSKKSGRVLVYYGSALGLMSLMAITAKIY
jgi:hypothetical protein